MADPMTIGDLVSSTLAAAEPEVMKTSVGEAAKDAYKALKAQLFPSASAELDALEASPASNDTQLAVARVIDERSAEEQQALRDLAEKLIATLKESAPAIGVDIDRLSALERQVRASAVAIRAGVRIGENGGAAGKI